MFRVFDYLLLIPRYTRKYICSSRQRGGSGTEPDCYSEASCFVKRLAVDGIMHKKVINQQKTVYEKRR